MTPLRKSRSPLFPLSDPIQSEVRRAALVNIPLTLETLETILTRTRDVDTLTRKLAYSAVLGAKLQDPRQLTISQREELVKTGLGDREAAVRAAVGKLLDGWFDLALSEVKDIQDQFTWKGDDGGVMKAFIHFLAWFDVVGTGEAVAVDAILSVLTTKTALCDVFVFQGILASFFHRLVAEYPLRGVLARFIRGISRPRTRFHRTLFEQQKTRAT